MSDVFSIGNILNENDNSNLINISMNFGNVFDLISKIYLDDFSIYNSKINKNLSDLADNINTYGKYFTELSTTTLKDISAIRQKFKSVSLRIEKNYKELEKLITEKRKLESENGDCTKIIDKLINVFIEFEENNLNYKSVSDELSQSENSTNEIIRNLFNNTIKLVHYSICKLKQTITYFAEFKKIFSQKILKTVEITIESFTGYQLFIRKVIRI